MGAITGFRNVVMHGNQLYIGGSTAGHAGTFYEVNGRLFTNAGWEVTAFEGQGGLVPGWTIQTSRNRHYKETGAIVTIAPKFSDVGVVGTDLYAFGKYIDSGYAIYDGKLKHLASGREVVEVDAARRHVTLKAKWYE